MSTEEAIHQSLQTTTSEQSVKPSSSTQIVNSNITNMSTNTTPSKSNNNKWMSVFTSSTSVVNSDVTSIKDSTINPNETHEFVLLDTQSLECLRFALRYLKYAENMEEI